MTDRSALFLPIVVRKYPLSPPPPLPYYIDRKPRLIVRPRFCCIPCFSTGFAIIIIAFISLSHDWKAYTPQILPFFQCLCVCMCVCVCAFRHPIFDDVPLDISQTHWEGRRSGSHIEQPQLTVDIISSCSYSLSRPYTRGTLITHPHLLLKHCFR